MTQALEEVLSPRSVMRLRRKERSAA